MGLIDWLMLALGWGAWVAFSAVVRAQSTRRDDPRTGLVLLALSVYVRILHRLTVIRMAPIPRRHAAGPLIVVANHTAGVDPLLIQSACPFEIHWLMAEDMKLASLDPLWRWLRIIFVDRSNGTGLGVRDALDSLKTGGVIGVFPEGGIEPACRAIQPFQPGVGLLVRRSKARVLPVLISGTPKTALARQSLWAPSRAQLRFMPVVEYGKGKFSANQIAQDLHDRFVRWSQQDR